MANIVLFHSVYGRRPAVLAAAEVFLAAGHVVTIPDLYDGRVVDDVEQGRAIRAEIGWEELVRRADQAVGQAPVGTVYAGFSMGAFLADGLARRDPTAGGLLLLSSTGDAEAEQRLACPWQLHTTEGDPWVTPEERAQWAAAEKGGEIFLYPGSGHLYTDPGLPGYDEEATRLTWERTLVFLASL